MPTFETDPAGLTQREIEHDAFIMYGPMLKDLQAAMKTAMESGDPVACICYEADKDGSLRELTAYFTNRSRSLLQDPSGNISADSYRALWSTL
jgi:hypothetical protein